MISNRSDPVLYLKSNKPVILLFPQLQKVEQSPEYILKYTKINIRYALFNDPATHNKHQYQRAFPFCLRQPAHPWQHPQRKLQPNINEKYKTAKATGKITTPETDSAKLGWNKAQADAEEEQQERTKKKEKNLEQYS